jgi:AcrR family transcriptional regulator
MVNLYHPLVRMIEMAIRLFNEQGIGAVSTNDSAGALR